jgi:hypothetical protein
MRYESKNVALRLALTAKMAGPARVAGWRSEIFNDAS